VLKGKARITAGEWVVEGAELVQTGGEEGGVVFGRPDWADYDITVDLMHTNGKFWCGLQFRSISRNNSAGHIGMEIGSKGCGIGHWVGENGEDLDERTLRLEDHKWYTARVEAHGRQIKCTLLDNEGLTLVDFNPWEDKKNRHPKGQVGVWTNGGLFRFRNIKVTSPDGKTLWEMPPPIVEPPMPPAKMDDKRQASTRVAPDFTSQEGKKSLGVVKKDGKADAPGPGKRESIGRTITDSMLAITTNNNAIMRNANGNFQLQVDRNITATSRDEKIYINEVFGRKDVLCTVPLSPSSPGTIDFSRITQDGTGSLILRIHSYPRSPGGRIVVKSDGVTRNDAAVEFGDAWKKIVVPFRRNKIVVEHHALGWMMEFMFIDYEVVPDPPGIPTRARTRSRS
jgi:hypothetical protein